MRSTKTDVTSNASALEVDAESLQERKTAPINVWKPSCDAERFVKQDDLNDKIFVCRFDMIYDEPAYARYNKFHIKKGSYENQLPLICEYINFFINNYDTDHELISAYLKIKYELDKVDANGKSIRYYTADNMQAYIDLVYELLFTKSIVEKINRMVEDNYLDDIETENDIRRKAYKKNEKKHLESLEFTNQHIKVLLRVSIGMKFMTPVLFHYTSVNDIKLDKTTDTIYLFYRRLFDIFGHVFKHTDEAYIRHDKNYFYVWNKTTEYFDKYDDITRRQIGANISPATIDKYVKNGEIDFEPRDYYQFINILMKLYVYVKAKANESYSSNSVIFELQEIFGVDLINVINSFLHRVLISENISKLRFNKVWDKKQKKYKENPIGFIKTVIKYQIFYFVREQFALSLTEVTPMKNSEGLSGSDKMAMNLTKIDEGITILSEVNVYMTLQWIMNDSNITITDDEINFYMEHYHPNKLQVLLVHSYFAKYFGSYRDLKLATFKQFIMMMIILKKKLCMELGFSSMFGDDGELRPMALPYIISGACVGHLNTRIIRNTQLLQEIEDSYTFQTLNEDIHKYLNLIKPDYDLQIVSTLINTQFTFVEYEKPELLEVPINYADDKIADEILFFLNAI